MALDIDALRGKLNELTRKTKRSDVLWKPEEGDSVVRIVPLAEDPTNPFIEMQFHYLGQRTNLSPLTYGEPDPIAEFCQQLRAGGRLSREEYNETRKFEPKPRTFVPVIVRGQESAGVKFWGFGKTIFTELLAIIDDPDYGDITHPKTGRDIKVNFTPKEKSPTRFPQTKILVSPKQTPISEDSDFVKKVLTEQPDINEVYTRKSYEELQAYLKAYLQPKSEVEEDDSDDEWGSPSKPSSSNVETASVSTNKQSAEEMFADMFEDD